MLKTERLLYDYGVHVGQPPISQNHLDLRYVKMCSCYGVIGIIDSPCLLPDLTEYSESILYFVRLNVDRRADNASSVIISMAESLKDADSVKFADEDLARLAKLYDVVTDHRGTLLGS